MKSVDQSKVLIERIMNIENYKSRTYT